ncbi:hypothetical protein JXA48_02415 [Candidatus Woesearchaeota archaeon]|nr:hypothetical protein [Candidatus Woesearchaeota archaeon]
MFFSKRKGQAALEYLVTYGWALAVIVVAVGVLSYFGFLNPNRYIPDSCEFGEQLKCVDQYIDANADGSNGQIVMRFRNNFEDSINITNAYATTKPITFKDDNSGQGYVVIERGEVGRVYFDTTESIFPGTKERFGIVIEFKRTGGNVKHNITGEVFTEVSENELGLLS